MIAENEFRDKYFLIIFLLTNLLIAIYSHKIFKSDRLILKSITYAIMVAL